MAFFGLTLEHFPILSVAVDAISTLRFPNEYIIYTIYTTFTKSAFSVILLNARCFILRQKQYEEKKERLLVLR